MTNLSGNKIKKNLITPETAGFLIPIIIGFLMLLTLALGVTTPIYLRIINKKSFITYLEEKISLIPIYQQNLSIVQERKLEASNQQDRLLNLVAGEKDIKTILNKINEITLRYNVAIEEVKPKSVNNPNINLNKKIINDGPFKNSLIKTFEFLIVLKGEFNHIIDVLREIELLETIIISNSFQINSIDNISQENKIKEGNINQMVKIKLDLAAYGRKNLPTEINKQEKLMK